MSIPAPRDGDERRTGPLGDVTHKPAKTTPEQPEWAPCVGRPGFFINKTGKLKYDPSKDPKHPAYQQRIP